MWKQRARRDDGQDLVEYGLLAALIAVGAIGALELMGDQVDSLWTAVRNLL